MKGTQGKPAVQSFNHKNLPFSAKFTPFSKVLQHASGKVKIKIVYFIITHVLINVFSSAMIEFLIRRVGSQTKEMKQSSEDSLIVFR